MRIERLHCLLSCLVKYCRKVNILASNENHKSGISGIFLNFRWSGTIRSWVNNLHWHSAFLKSLVISCLTITTHTYSTYTSGGGCQVSKTLSQGRFGFSHNTQLRHLAHQSMLSPRDEFHRQFLTNWTSGRHQQLCYSKTTTKVKSETLWDSLISTQHLHKLSTLK